MSTYLIDSRSKRREPNDIATLLGRKLMGQPAAIETIVPYIEMHRAMLSPEGRPAGVFLLVGPTGTGKTRTVEALADVLHHNPKKLLRIDCGEFQMDHEVAKLIGAPPGYLGHRETQPILTQQKLNAASSEACDLSLVLFDEIEKAANSLGRLLLGILDKGTLRLGDGTTVNFEKTLIFLTTNLGAESMNKEMHPDFGFESLVPRADPDRARKLQCIGAQAVQKQFPPEFVNRIDALVTYQPLSPAALTAILDQQVDELRDLVDKRLGNGAFHLEVPARARRFLLDKGTSELWGARELKRTLHRFLIQPLASFVANGGVRPQSHLRADLSSRKDKLVIRNLEKDALQPAC